MALEMQHGVRTTEGEKAGATSPELDRLCINTIRFLAVDAVEKAKSGHAGAPMGMAPMGYTLWTRFLKHNPSDPHWFDRDRFVLSNGHASLLLYSLLHLTGYDLPLEQIKQFRQFGSETPGHPESLDTPGVELTTGPLGAGFATSLGFAMAEKTLGARFNRPGHEIINHYTYGFCSDGDMMEGVASEAGSLAGRLGLGKLIFLTTTIRSRSRAGPPWRSTKMSACASKRTDGTCSTSMARMLRPCRTQSRRRALKPSARR